MAWYWIMLIAVGIVALFFVAGHATHPRLHVKRVQDSKLISPKYQHLFGRDAVTGAMKEGRAPAVSRGVRATAVIGACGRRMCLAAHAQSPN